LREPDPAVYLEADRICEEISQKQAMREELASGSVMNEPVDDSNYRNCRRSCCSVAYDIN